MIPCVCRAATKRSFAEENRWFWGGAILENQSVRTESASSARAVKTRHRVWKQGMLTTDPTLAPQTGDFLFNTRAVLYIRIWLLSTRGKNCAMIMSVIMEKKNTYMLTFFLFDGEKNYIDRTMTLRGGEMGTVF